jgi:Cu(I)/Ag(I) efflux system membrane fusion protein
MNTKIVSVIAGTALGAGLVLSLPEGMLFRSVHTEEAASSNERWACPMICFIGSKAGTCPVCGMQMTQVSSGELTREQTRRMGVETTRIERGPASVTVRAYGAAEYDHRFTRVVIPRVSGRIVERHMATWGCCERVQVGEAIVDLYSPELIASQGELQAAIRMGDAALIQSLRLRFERWNLSEVAEALIAGKDIQDVVTIRSPFAGQVLLAEFEMANDALAVGKDVSADTPLLRLVDPDRLALVVHVPETRAFWLREGQSVLIESDDAGPLPHLKAVVERVAGEINPELRSLEVRIYLEGARDVLKPGSLVHARFDAVLNEDLRPADAANRETWGSFVLVPKSAVLSTGVRHVAWRVAERKPDGRTRFEPVSLALGPRIEGPDGNDLYIVRAGLSDGDEVALQGAFLIDSQAQLAGSVSLLNPSPLVPEGSAHAHH